MATLDKKIIAWMRKNSIFLLRIALGIIFLWLGALKVFGASPVEDIIAATYPFLSPAFFLPILGVWEIVIGLGLLFKISLRFVLVLLWMQMAGTILAVPMAPSIFFRDGNPLLLTMAGEFVVKNFALITASLAIGGYETLPLTNDVSTDNLEHTPDKVDHEEA